ncbi:DUF1232 domain-containing protein [Rhizobium sp. CFBP 8762]|uniref:YkvA family protein n=1 Tax=Rhizobium sp. CFBP 8762 TaxID=2775279 RepID=UPI001783F336|nr:YkvA family protein [Rhizobium sp. CFBP 8762]MBD8555461.1 DUF1232 domain-containing protein [Rhizobium sp. CFBP 8762]
MSEIKFGEILLPGDEQEQAKREAKVRKRFWPTIKRAVRVIPFSRDLVAAYYCALDKETPLRVRGILLGALAYFVLPIDTVPDFLAVVGFSDDIAVLTAAFTAIKGHIKDRHYVAADKALSENLTETV